MAEKRAVMEEIEETAGERLGVERWDRPAVFREAADAATDSDLPYWLVLLLSGAIATLGLALNSSAVVIGAMLVAPLLAPVVGLALGLATGDSRLTLHTAVMVLASTVGVILTGVLLTALLPFQTITAEISARTRPTTLDLAIAVFSGLAGAVVTVGRGKRLSAAVPGVAISVALIPPLAVAGFGIGMGWNFALIRGALLLYGANLAGIVLSGMVVFLLVGMHREDVLRAARRWHEGEEHVGLLGWVDRSAWVRSLGISRSVWRRMGLVVAFVVAMGVPLEQTLDEITRERRVGSAVDAAEEIFDVEGRSSILGRQVVRGSGRTQVYLRVATAEWFGDEAREAFERRASARAGEPVRLTLEQLPATSGNVAQLAEMLPGQEPRPVTPPPPPAPTRLPNLLAEVRARARRAVEALPLPEGVEIGGVEVVLGGDGRTVIRVAYSASAPLPPQAEEILARQLAGALDAPGMQVELAHTPPAPAGPAPAPPAPR